MIEKILESVINAMVPHLEPEQLEKLNNVLYINFHGVEVVEQCTELTATGTDGDVAKIKMFVASKKRSTGRTTPCGSTPGRLATCWPFGEAPGGHHGYGSAVLLWGHAGAAAHQDVYHADAVALPVIILGFFDHRGDGAQQSSQKSGIAKIGENDQEAL